jgi:uncharacterized protein (TIGR00251 family)
MSADAKAFFQETPEGLRLAVKVQPRASKNEILPPKDGELKIRVTAPPVDSAANEAVVALLSEKLKISRSRITIVRGQTSRHKTIFLAGVAASQLNL